jgi:hypothetical protein
MNMPVSMATNRRCAWSELADFADEVFRVSDAKEGMGISD